MPTEINYFLIQSASDNSATWIAIGSAFISLCALAIAAIQTSITRNHNQLSVRPHLAIDVKQVGGICTATLRNTGFGPAKIVDAQLYVDGDLHHGEGTELIESAFAKIGGCEIKYTEFFYPPYVLPTNEPLKLFEVEFDDNKIPDFRDFIVTRLQLDLKYECFYGTSQSFTSNP